MKPLTPTEVAICENVLNLDAGPTHWAAVAAFASRPEIADWLIERAKLTPYTNIDGYMDRDWLVNPYPLTEEDRAGFAYGHLSSARIHHILRRDHDRHHHDHPWRARTIVLRGWYEETRRMADGSERRFLRQPGDTVTLDLGEYHTITEVSEGGVWTMFITGQYQGTWHFLVDGVPVPWRTYLKIPAAPGTPAAAEEGGA